MSQVPPIQPTPQPPKKSRTPVWIIVVIVAVVLICVLIAVFGRSPRNTDLSEQQYKDSTSNATVASLDKDGNNGAGQEVHLTAQILNFVKDSNGNTTAANVSDPGTFSSIIQVQFPVGTDVSQLNTQDQIEVWGTDKGTATGTNAFGATVQEVWIEALYMTDTTTGYSA